jgi:hypothetical protein
MGFACSSGDARILDGGVFTVESSKTSARPCTGKMLKNDFLQIGGGRSFQRVQERLVGEQRGGASQSPAIASDGVPWLADEFNISPT